ncbi:uncharacterized protein JCM6883_003734 [Sporobolomyces salmoneus]|uniref:uncharacterized protein n=1 Tax=Sporobolomyces salmoneus TaxID=183962 RepID=UPI00316CF68C
MHPLKHRDSASRTRPVDPRIQQAKGLGLELKNLLKTNEPWNREVEFQRDATRKAYLQIVFSSPSLTSSSLALLSSSSAQRSSSSSSNSTALEALNLLWLETTHALITIYRSKLAKMDKQIAENPKPPSRKGGGQERDKRGGNDGNVQYAHPHGRSTSSSSSTTVVGPVARRKLLQQFQKFLNSEQEFWKLLLSRLASRLLPSEQLELRPLGIIASHYDDTNTSSQPEEEVSEEERRRRRREVLPLAHKGLICFGDLARYIEYNSDLPTPAPATTSGGRGGKNRGGKKDNSTTSTTVKTYSKASECYRQANLLIPDDGNSHNQLAVLSQYSNDPLASTYHYYRALTVRIPFSTAGKNLEIAYSKSLQRYDFEGEKRRFEQEREWEGGLESKVQVKKFREGFMALHAIFFTKTHLNELKSLMKRVEEMFQGCTRERLITSDGVLKIVVTSLAALWHARLTRSKALNDNSTLQLSKLKSTSELGSLKPTSSKVAETPSASVGPKLEPHILLHVLQLYTSLLSLSSSETNELYTSNLTSSSSVSIDENNDEIPPLSLDSNISAVLRRSIPALRILGRWLKTQLDYIERVEKRLIEKEKKRLRARKRASGGTSSLEEAQRSLDSSGGGTGTGSQDETVLSSREFEETLDGFWQAFADYSNSIKLAFPNQVGRLPVLEEGVWLEEDVECLGFAPLRRKSAGMGDTREGARRVGRDVHPNQEVLMRIEEAQRFAEEIVDSPFSRVALVDGAYVFVPQEEPYLDEADEEGETTKDQEMNQHEELEIEGEEDIEMRDQSTEDDPVDRAMRTAANQLELDGVEEEEFEDDESEEEQIVFSGSRNSSQPPVSRDTVAQQPSVPPGFAPRQDTRSSPLTAADLRQQLFSPSQPLPPVSVASTPIRSSSQPPSSKHGSPSLFVPTSNPASPHALSSIWGAPPVPSIHLPHSSSGLRGPSLVPSHQQQQQQPQAMTAHSFEAIPNLTHDSFAAHQLGWGAPAQPSTTSHLPPPPLPHIPSAQPPAQLFGNHQSFLPPPLQSQSHTPVFPPTNDHDFSRSFSLPPTASRAPPSAPQASQVQSQPSLFLPPGLSTAHVGLNPMSPLPRLPSNGGGFGFPQLPKPTGNENGGGGGWPVLPTGRREHGS